VYVLQFAMEKCIELDGSKTAFDYTSELFQKLFADEYLATRNLGIGGKMNEM
jgi:hypothetical protein